MDRDQENSRNNNQSERNWNDVSGQDQSQNKDSKQSDKNKTDQNQEVDRRREGQGNEIVGSSEHLSPKSGGQETNPRGRMQEESNLNSNNKQ
jgi:hypothetical protein